MVFQAPCLLPWMSSFGNVMLGVKRVYPHATKAERKDLVEYYLSLVGLADAMHKMPLEMSGGMQQRVGIARAIALKPKVLLLDEPFGRLDSLTRMDLQDVILDILEPREDHHAGHHPRRGRGRVHGRPHLHDDQRPGARVGQVLDIPFERPRDRKAVLADEMYYDLRGSLIDFLEKFDKHKKPAAAEVAEAEEEPAYLPEPAAIASFGDYKAAESVYGPPMELIRA